MNKHISLALLISLGIACNTFSMDSDDEGYASAREESESHSPEQRPLSSAPSSSSDLTKLEIDEMHPNPAPNTVIENQQAPDTRTWWEWFKRTPAAAKPTSTPADTKNAINHVFVPQYFNLDDLVHQADGSFELIWSDSKGEHHRTITEERFTQHIQPRSQVRREKSDLEIHWKRKNQVTFAQDGAPVGWGAWTWGWTGGAVVNGVGYATQASKDASTNAAVAVIKPLVEGVATEQFIQQSVGTAVDQTFDSTLKNIDEKVIPRIEKLGPPVGKWVVGIVGATFIIWNVYEIGKMKGKEAGKKDAAPKPLNPYLQPKPTTQYKIPKF